MTRMSGVSLSPSDWRGHSTGATSSFGTQTHTNKQLGGEQFSRLDFFPDATRLVSASDDGAVTVWDVATASEVRRFVHEDWVYAAKYCTSHHVRVWDNEDGRLLHKIQLSWSSGVGLFWVYNLLFVTSKYKVWKIKRTIISEWSIPETNETSCTVPQGHGEFFVSATGRTVRFWDILTQIQLLPIQRSQDIKSVTHSPDDQFIAIAGKDGKITIKRLSHISVSTVSSCISTFLLKLSPLGHFSIHCTRFVEARQTHGCGRIVARCNPHV